MIQLQQVLAEAVRAAVKKRFGLQLENVVLERPPQVQLGDLATPLPFELARQLKRAPRQIASELTQELGQIDGVKSIEGGGAGYLNFYFNRGRFFAKSVDASRAAGVSAAADTPKTIVEHTNINPNKAAHIGHLRNAVLGDSFVRLLRFGGQRVEVQNYIDNTGVQVADVVVGFQRLEKKTLAEVEQIIRRANPRIDFYCWDLYARVSQFYEEDKTRLELRARALQEIEKGEGETARVADLISTAIVRCHLETAYRIGVQYDVLPRESEILNLRFWDAAFEKLKDGKAIEFAEEGKNKGCWVMRMGEDDATGGDLEDAKIIVRSNGTVTYVGKDIAYQMWKFGLLDRDFAYRPFHTYADSHVVWMSATRNGKGAPVFGHARRVYNVIDSRQSYLQNIVAAGVKAMGFDDAANNSIHFSYEMVGLSPRCARELGIELTAEDAQRPFVEVSGRKGRGVKADDLLDALEANALREVTKRHPDVEADRQRELAHKIAVAALRFFMLRYTRNSVIAFDFKDALSFEGETGPYLQYSVVRVQNIFRKLQQSDPGFPLDELPRKVTGSGAEKWLGSPAGDDLWELVLSAAELPWVAQVAVREQEPAIVAKWAFGLAQRFNLFYHTHHILSEPDPDKKAFLLLLADLVQRRLSQALSLLGIEIPERM